MTTKTGVCENYETNNKVMENSLVLMRHLLNLVDLEDIEKLKKEELTDGEFQNRANDTEIFYSKYFEKVLKLFIQTQMELIVEEANSVEDLQLLRGTIHGLILVKQWFDKQINASKSRFDGGQESVPGESITPVGVFSSGR